VGGKGKHTSKKLFPPYEESYFVAREGEKSPERRPVRKNQSMRVAKASTAPLYYSRSSTCFQTGERKVRKKNKTMRDNNPASKWGGPLVNLNHRLPSSIFPSLIEEKPGGKRKRKTLAGKGPRKKKTMNIETKKTRRCGKCRVSFSSDQTFILLGGEKKEGGGEKR